MLILPYDDSPADIQIQPWTNGKRTISYSRPLGGKIGSTKCEGEETIIQPDGCEDWWGVEGITRTPGVPAGKRCVVSKSGWNSTG